MSDETILLPCPFCGSNNAPEISDVGDCEECISFDDCLYREKNHTCEGCDEWDRPMFVVCNYNISGCGVSGPYRKTKAEAIAAWNTRAELGNDDDYERKIDALLCRLTNGKWSKSRAYDLDFMEQCINEEFEMLYAKEPADVELGNGTLTAEQVMAIAGRHQPDYCSDTHVCFDWQAIADELNVELGSDTSAARLAERLRSIADEMRNVGASSMKPHELLAFYAREVDKVADSLKFAATLGSDQELRR